MTSDFLSVPQLLSDRTGPSSHVFSPQSMWLFHYFLLPKTEPFHLHGKKLGPGIPNQNFKITSLFLIKQTKPKKKKKNFQGYAVGHIGQGDQLGAL